MECELAAKVNVNRQETKFVKGRRLSRKHKVKNTHFPGVTVDDMEDFVKPIIRMKPKK